MDGTLARGAICVLRMLWTDDGLAAAEAVAACEGVEPPGCDASSSDEDSSQGERPSSSYRARRTSMNRRDFLGGGLGTMVAGASSGGALFRSEGAERADAASPPPGQIAADPRDVRINLKPVMTNLIHTAMWEGPCRWTAVSVETEKAQAERRFAAWCKQIRQTRLNLDEGTVRLLDPVHIKFCEDFVLRPEELNKLKPDIQRTDAYFIIPSGSSIAAFQIGQKFARPILLKGLNCRNVDIAAYSRSRGCEAYVPADDDEFREVVSLLRARKVFRATKVLFPTNWGLPAVASVGSIWDLEDLQKRLGMVVRRIPYQELAGEMGKVMGSKSQAEEAERLADELLRRAQASYIDRKYVVRSVQFYQAVTRLMNRHGLNAFTIECFEFCASRLPEQWQITPCLIHALLRNRQCASSCEADLGSLLAMRMLMSVSGKSPHQGNSDPRAQGTFRINHSAPSMKMNGFDQPDLPYQLGRFVSQGWGTKVVIDFMDNSEKTVTVARVNPKATKVLVLRGELVGASGWGKDLVGCSVEAVIKPPEGRADEFLKKRLDYGNHLQWVYGDYSGPMRQLGEMLGLDVEVIS
jgi:hypothetical protein